MDKVNQNFILSSCEDIREICDGLLSPTAISYYNFVRLYKDGSRISLSNDHAWTKYFLNECHKYELVFEGELTQKMHKYIIWDNVDTIVSGKLINIARNEFNIDHGFTIVEPDNDFVDFHYFATKQDQCKMNSYYINNLNSFHKFILLFMNKAEQIIQLANKHKIHLLNSTKSNTNSTWIYEDSHTDHLLIDESYHFHLKGNYKDICLTKREIECVGYKVLGSSYKEISSILKISPRTVETHLNKAKIKLNCSTLSEIKKIAKKSGLENIFKIIIH